MRIPQANVYATAANAGATVLSISAGHILATLALAVGELSRVSAVVASINRETTVIETGETIPVTAPDQVVVAGQLVSDAVVSITVQGGAAPAAPGFEVRVVGTEATLTVQPATPGGMHIVDWAISIAKADGSSEALAVPGRLSRYRRRFPPGRLATWQRVPRTRSGDRRRPTGNSRFADAVGYHELLSTVQRASDTGVRQDIAADEQRVPISDPDRLPIVDCGDPVLRQPAEPVDPADFVARAAASCRVDAGDHGGSTRRRSGRPTGRSGAPARRAPRRPGPMGTADRGGASDAATERLALHRLDQPHPPAGRW